jgi:hypothetical protein
LMALLLYKELTIRRLRAVFGIKTETAKKLLNLAGGKSEEKPKRPKKIKRNRVSMDISLPLTIQRQKRLKELQSEL